MIYPKFPQEKRQVDHKICFLRVEACDLPCFGGNSFFCFCLSCCFHVSIFVVLLLLFCFLGEGLLLLLLLLLLVVVVFVVCCCL